MTDTTHENAAAPEKDQAIETTPTAVPVEYSARVVRLGDIIPVAVEPEAAPDITDSGDEDLEHKTFAGFGIPVLEDVIAPDEDGYDELLNPGKPQALIVLPTRELTKQVVADLRNAAKYLNTRIVDVYGGVAFEPQSLKMLMAETLVMLKTVILFEQLARLWTVEMSALSISEDD